MSGGRGDQMKLVKKLRKQGFTVERTGSGHWKVTNEKGESTTLAFSPRKVPQHKTLKHLEEMGFER